MWVPNQTRGPTKLDGRPNLGSSTCSREFANELEGMIVQCTEILLQTTDRTGCDNFQ